LTRVLSDPTRRDFFDPKGKEGQNLRFLADIFQTQTKDGLPDPTQPDPQKTDPTQVKNF